MSGQQRHGWLHALSWIAILAGFIIPAGIQANPDRIPQETVQLPVSWQKWAHIETLPSTDALRAFKRGMEYYLKERYAAALEALPDDQAAGATAVGDYILFYRAKSKLMLERKKDALNDFRLLESRYPDSPLSREALTNQCQILLAMNEAASALALLDNPKIGTNSETLYYQARALDLAGKKEQATELYLLVYSRYPTSKFSPLAERYLLSLSPRALEGVRNYDARLQRAESLISEENFKSARTLLAALGRVSSPNSKSSEKRSLLFGEVEYHLGRTSAAIPYLRKVTSLDPALHAKALYLEGLCSRKLEKEEAFLALRDKALKLYPRSSAAEELCYSAATYLDVKYDENRGKPTHSFMRLFPRASMPNGPFGNWRCRRTSKKSTTKRRLDSGNTCVLTPARVPPHRPCIGWGAAIKSWGIPKMQNIFSGGSVRWQMKTITASAPVKLKQSLKTEPRVPAGGDLPSQPAAALPEKSISTR